MELDNCIVGGEARRQEDGTIRLKLFAIAGGTGPALILPRSLAESVCKALSNVLADEKLEVSDWGL